MSLRSRILALAVGVAAAVLVLFAVPLVLLLRQAAVEDAQQNAVDVAQGVADYISTGDVDAGALVDFVDRINDRDDSYPVEVVAADGTIIGTPLSDSDEWDFDDDDLHGGSDHEDDDEYGELLSTSQARVRSVDGGYLVAIGVDSSDGPVTVNAFAPASEVRHEVEEAVAMLAGAGVVLLLVAAGAAELVARRLVRHLTAAAETADLLGEGDLSARVPDEGPQEVRRVGAALNRLAGRIDELLAAERETVADLSHRLRTPMTAVRLDVESLPDSDRKA